MLSLVEHEPEGHIVWSTSLELMVHFPFPSSNQTLEHIRLLQPLSAYIIGMTHQFDHEAVNEELRQWSLK